MTPRTYNASELPDYSISTQAPLWWGQLTMAVIEGSMFSILIAMYLYLRLRVDVWPPHGIRLPELTLPTAALVPLILSALGSYWASEGAKKNDRSAMLKGIILNIALAVVFLVLRAIEWRSFDFTWASDIHGTLVWTILFLHTVDVVGDLFFTTVLLVIIARGRYGPEHQLGVHVDSVVWYFLVLIWLPLYVLVYWGPHILRGGV